MDALDDVGCFNGEFANVWPRQAPFILQEVFDFLQVQYIAQIWFVRYTCMANLLENLECHIVNLAFQLFDESVPKVSIGGSTVGHVVRNGHIG